jgi:hypothetical protein
VHVVSATKLKLRAWQLLYYSRSLALDFFSNFLSTLLQ